MTMMSHVNNLQKALGPVTNALYSAFNPVFIAIHYLRPRKKISDVWKRVRLIQWVTTAGLCIQWLTPYLLWTEDIMQIMLPIIYLMDLKPPELASSSTVFIILLSSVNVQLESFIKRLWLGNQDAEQFIAQNGIQKKDRKNGWGYRIPRKCKRAY